MENLIGSKYIYRRDRVQTIGMTHANNVIIVELSLKPQLSQYLKKTKSDIREGL